MLINQKDGLPVCADELISLFAITVKDIYLVKAKLINYLPLMAGLTSKSELKLVILDCGISTSAQLLRLNMLLAILKQTRVASAVQPVELVDLDAYLGRTINGSRSAKTDALLLVHLSMIEGMEITSFILLRKLATKLRHKWVYHLLKKNLEEAVQNKKKLDLLLDTYLPV